MFSPLIQLWHEKGQTQSQVQGYWSANLPPQAAHAPKH